MKSFFYAQAGSPLQGCKTGMTFVSVCLQLPVHFADDTIEHSLRQNAKPDFKSTPWNSIPPSAKDLVMRLMESVPKTRLMPKQVLQNSWITQELGELQSDVSF